MLKISLAACLQKQLTDIGRCLSQLGKGLEDGNVSTAPAHDTYRDPDGKLVLEQPEGFMVLSLRIPVSTLDTMSCLRGSARRSAARPRRGTFSSVPATTTC